LLDEMEEECHAIKQNSLRMAWYMRGGATYTDILNMSMQEREAIAKIIEDNIETTKNSKMPLL